MDADKLNKFSTIVLREALAQKESRVQAVDLKLKKAIKKYATEANEKSRLYIDNEMRRINIINSKKIADEQQIARQEISDKRIEITNRLYTDVVKRVNSFVQSPEYKKWLLEITKKTLNKYTDEEITLVITKSDERFAIDLQKITDAKIEVSSEDFIGGIKCVCAKKKIVDNCTLLLGLQEARDTIEELI